MRHRKSYVAELKAHIATHKTEFAVYSIMRLLVILTFVASLIEKRYENAALCILSLVLLLLPAVVEQNFGIELPSALECIIYCFIFAAEILGEINSFYVTIPGWDTMLHTINGFLCAAIGFALVDMLNRNSPDIKLSPFYLALVAFCFSMTVGVMWEFFEHFMDQTLLLDMQKDTIVTSFSSTLLDATRSNHPVVITGITDTIINTAGGKQYVISNGYLDIGINDTMKDLFVNFIGAAVFSAIGYAYVKTEGSNSLARQFIPTVVRPEQQEKKKG